MRLRPLLGILLVAWAGEAAAGVITDPPPGLNEPRFYQDLKVTLDELAKSPNPIVRRLIEAARASPAAIRFHPMTGDRATWNSNGSRDLAHTEPDDRRPKKEGRDKPSDATVYVPRASVERGKGKSGVLVHELVHAIDLANGRYNADAAIRERRAVFMQNLWRGEIGSALRTSYHDRFPTDDYQEAKRRGALDEYAEYIFARSDFPAPRNDSRTK